MAERLLQTAVAGSFKFKPEIDALHGEFRDHGVTVLEPTMGWLWSPGMRVGPSLFRPLPLERDLSIREIEGRFLGAIDKADFLYVYNPEAYMGASTAFEIGYALARETPIYAHASPDFMEMADCDLERKAFLESRIVIAGVAEVVRIERAKREALMA
jgi:hypothetical protein